MSNNLNKKYEGWITENYPSRESAKLQCAEATKAMAYDFPELTRVRGHVMVGVNMRPHWWLEDADGKVIDPTAHQWGTQPVFYEKAGEEEPLGKCLDCGILLFRSKGDNRYLCSTHIKTKITSSTK